MSRKAQEILDVAERLVRQRGYNGFSFRDLADAVGVKSASVHYHFPSKGDLVEALAQRYAQRFFEAVGEPDSGPDAAEERLARFIAVFRASLMDQRQMCLCGMLGAEVAVLPSEVTQPVAEFFRRCVKWLQDVLQSKGAAPADAQTDAMAMLACLEGGLLVARASGDVTAFDRIANRALDRFGR